DSATRRDMDEKRDGGRGIPPSKKWSRVGLKPDLRRLQKTAGSPRKTNRPSVSYTCGNVLPLQSTPGQLSWPISGGSLSSRLLIPSRPVTLLNITTRVFVWPASG